MVFCMGNVNMSDTVSPGAMRNFRIINDDILLGNASLKVQAVFSIYRQGFSNLIPARNVEMT